MPVAKPKHIRAKSDKQFKTPEGEYYNPDVMSENMFALLEHLKERGALNDIYTQHMKDAPDLGTGSYKPGDKSLATIAGDSTAGGRTIAHEVTHALNWSELPSTEKRVREYADKHPFKSLGLVFPSRWEEGRVGAPLTSNTVPGHTTSPGESLPHILSIPFGPEKVDNLYSKTAKKMTQTVRESIPDERETWSGLDVHDKKSPYYHRMSDEEEGQAYYLTDPMVAHPMADRAKDFGMFLRSYGVPMDIVAPVVDELSQLAKPKNRYSGGSYEIKKLRQEKERRRTVND